MRAVFVAVAVFSALGLAAELWWFVDEGASYELVEMLSLSGEANLPTWFAAGMIAACAIGSDGLRRATSFIASGSAATASPEASSSSKPASRIIW